MRDFTPKIMKSQYAEGGDKLPFEYPIKEALKIYAYRWLVWLIIVFISLIPLLIWIMENYNE